MTKTSVFVVRGEQSGAPESYLLGVYPTKELAEARCKALQYDESIDYDADDAPEQFYEFVWYDEVLVGAEGADCFFSNR